ncbi:MAG: metalloregulator ArsR/SmtB family transcription factor [Actinomycetota bacterium]|jgi:DNA-binding transcriptional ArsR family regulator
MDDALRAVADPTRRAILSLVLDGERPAGEIAGHFPGMSRPAVSQHLRVLSDAGLVELRQEGARRLYRARPEGLDDVRLFLDGLRTRGSARPGAVEQPSQDRHSPKERTRPTPGVPAWPCWS